ncbi:MAG: hypothetical protein R2727_05905 [Bacteroidales bacterium]
MLEIYFMNGDPDDFERLVNWDFSKAHIIIRLSDPRTRTINNVLGEVRRMAAEDGVDAVTGGYAYIMSQFAGKIVRGRSHPFCLPS